MVFRSKNYILACKHGKFKIYFVPCWARTTKYHTFIALRICFYSRWKNILVDRKLCVKSHLSFMTWVHFSWKLSLAGPLLWSFYHESRRNSMKTNSGSHFLLHALLWSRFGPSTGIYFHSSTQKIKNGGNCCFAAELSMKQGGWMFLGSQNKSRKEKKKTASVTFLQTRIFAFKP